MTMETTVEYYFGETLRWSFGFDNPNKAAVLFACAVPLLWCLWLAAASLKNRWLKVPALLISAALLLAAWYCLIMTFSRGGLVAGVVALAYLSIWPIWQHRAEWKTWPRRVVVWFSVLLLGGMVAAVALNGLGERSATAFQSDASVENRFELWGSALQMAAENREGFGTGKSGEQYMQWYQPLDRQQGYRTMVNSYLTFWVEQGWLKSFWILVGFTLFWVWTKPRQQDRTALALRAGILGFLVAGIFSTTMEDWRLWPLPAASGLALALIAIYRKNRIERAPLFVMGTVILGGFGAMLAIGILKSSKDTLKREFDTASGTRSVTALGPQSPKARSLGVKVDESVMGDLPARLLREMAVAADVRILLGPYASEAQRLLCMGHQVHGCGTYAGKSLFLLAPEKMRESDVAGLAQRSEPTELLIPEIDEDGRVGFWDDLSEGKLAPHFKKTSLPGVGNRVDWAWAEVIEAIKNGG